MKNEDKIAILKNRYKILKERKINEKCGGCLRKIERQLRNAGALA
jgi:hypothetical protein